MMCTWINSVVDAKQARNNHEREKAKWEELNDQHKGKKDNVAKLEEEVKEAKEKLEKSEAIFNKQNQILTYE